MNASELQNAEKEIVRHVQRRAFESDFRVLHQVDAHTKPGMNDRKKVEARFKALKKSSSLAKLDPVIGQDSILRLRGRIQRANLPEEIKHRIFYQERAY